MLIGVISHILLFILGSMFGMFMLAFIMGSDDGEDDE